MTFQKVTKYVIVPDVIDSNDLFIAAHAKSLDAVLITNNTKEFERVENLVIENWVN